MQNKNVLVKSLLLVALFSISINAFAVWMAPSSLPVAGNTEPPVNVGSATQQKTGGIVVGGFRSTGPSIADTTFDIAGLTTLSGGLKITSGAPGINKVITSDANGLAAWSTIASIGALTNPMNTLGDIIYGGAAGVPTRLAAGTNGYFLKSNGPGTAPSWSALPAATNINGLITQGTNITLSGTGTTADPYTINASGGSGSTGWTDDGAVVRLTAAGDTVSIGDAVAGQQLKITKSFEMPDTTSSTTGIIFKGANRFIHNYGTTQNNTFVGLNSGNFSITGNGRDTALGYNTLNALTSGVDNTAVGWESAKGTTSADGNTSVGRSSLNDNTSGGNNTAIGISAAYKTTTGFDNTALGGSALYNNTTGDKNTALGVTAGPTTGALTNTTAIGFSTSVSVSNTMVFGNSNIKGWGFGVEAGAANAVKVGTNATNGNGARLTIGGTWTNSSDKTKKHDIQALHAYGLNEILQLQPVSFKWNNTNTDDIGLIAQEVKPIMPGLVYGEEGDMSIAYSHLTVPLINAVKELKTENDMLKKRIEALEAR